MKHGVQKSQAWASTERLGWLVCLLNSSKVQVFKSSKLQKFATWGERPASLCGGNTLSSQELQTPCQHDQLLLDDVNNSHPQHFSLRSDQRLDGSEMLRLVAPPVEVPPLSCWSSSPGLPPAPSCDIGESEKQVFSTVSSERKHEKKHYLYFVAIKAKIIIVATMILSISSWFPWLGQS